jgi:hypothetical protein
MPDHMIAHLTALQRHFKDLRDGTHGGAAGRLAKEELFRRAAALLDPVARQALAEVDAAMLADSGTVAGTGVVRASDGGLEARWTLGWPEQRRTALAPITIHAHYGRTFHHPHLRGATVGEWPLNVFTTDDAQAQLPTLRAIVTADLHNLVYQRDFRIVPVIRG